MKKVVAFVGSPRKNGNTAAVVEQILKGAKEAGVDSKVYRLNDMQIKPCQSCYYCRENDNCAIKDDMQAVYADIKEADAVIIGSPVYMFQITAQTKLLLDRLFPLLDADLQPRFGTKKTIMVYTQGDPNPETFKTSFDVNASLLKLMGLDITETLVSAGTTDLSSSANDSTLMSKAYSIGKSLNG